MSKSLIPDENYLVEDHPTEDDFGSEIRSGDTYFIDKRGRVIDSVNMEDYLIEVLGVRFYKAK